MSRKIIMSAAAIVLAAGTAVLLTGCVEVSRISDDHVDPIDYEKMVRLIETPKKPAVLVDVRQPKQFDQGHIPGAINIPINKLNYGDIRLAQAVNIIVYSASVSDMLSRAAAKTLLRLEYQNVYDFRGGLAEWQANHQAVEGEAVSNAGAGDE